MNSEGLALETGARTVHYDKVGSDMTMDTTRLIDLVVDLGEVLL